MGKSPLKFGCVRYELLRLLVIAGFKVCMINTRQNILRLCNKLHNLFGVEKTLDKILGIALGKTIEKNYTDHVGFYRILVCFV